jgi:hypothetical protein
MHTTSAFMQAWLKCEQSAVEYISPFVPAEITLMSSSNKHELFKYKFGDGSGRRNSNSMPT